MHGSGDRTICGGLRPICGSLPRVLILGSFPSALSLAYREYYGNPKNRFWEIMENLFGIPVITPYGDRCDQLTRQGIALWDVVASCSRRGSADSNIRNPEVNDIPGFAAEHPSLRFIALNGSMAGRLYHRCAEVPSVPSRVFPSTSPANAAVPFMEKTRIWASICDEL